MNSVTRRISPLRIWSVFWVVTFLFYLPAARSGQVGDYYKDWLRIVKHEPFQIYLNRPGSPTLYQFTQLFTNIFYKLFGSSPWAWHLLHISAHALCCLLLQVLLRRLFTNSGVKKATGLSVAASLLFCLSAYHTEVLVHEPCLHYSLGFAMMLGVILYSWKFLESGMVKYAGASSFLFLLSTFSHEIFYATPWMVLGLVIYYQRIQTTKESSFWSASLRLFLPLLLIFLMHLALLRIFTGHAVAHYTDPSAANQLWNFLTGLPKYLFHILLMGRFWPLDVKRAVYSALETNGILIGFYLLALIFALTVLIRSRRSKKWAAAGLLLFYTVLVTGIVTTRGFHSDQWVVFDRYAYFSVAFIYSVVVLLVAGMRPVVTAGVTGILLFANGYFLVKSNLLWYQSEKIVHSLLEGYPAERYKTTLLLNVPESLRGVLMIGAQEEGAFRMMLEGRYPDRGIGQVREVVSYAMYDVTDGAHVQVFNDSTIRVTLNQWGTWWCYHYLGASSYETSDYRVDMVDQGHWYELTLKKPIDEFRLLYSRGGEWKEVNADLRDTEQY